MTLGVIASSYDPTSIALEIVARRSAISERLAEDRQFVAWHAGQPVVRAIQAVHFLDEPVSGATLKARLADPATVALLTAVREGQGAVAAGLARWLRAANLEQRTDGLLLVPCENRVAPVLRVLAEQPLRRPLWWSPTLVDRLCTERGINADGVYVVTEAYMEWCIQLPANSGGAAFQSHDAATVISALGARPVSAVEPLAARKLVLFNGTHAGVAAKCLREWGDEAADLREYVATPAGSAFLSGLAAELAVAVEVAYGLPADEVRRYARDYVHRIRRQPDTVGRVLGRLVQGEFAQFEADIEAKLGEPLTILENEVGRSQFIREAQAHATELIRRYQARHRQS
ncbi:MAG: hypothetical protein ACJ74O_06240 [Frankiaceae bacterium]